MAQLTLEEAKQLKATLDLILNNKEKIAEMSREDIDNMVAERREAERGEYEES